MSSSLYLFDLNRHALALPTSFKDLEALRQTLQNKHDGKNLRFIEFALRFEERFPTPAAKAESQGRLPGPVERASALRRAAWQFDLPFVETTRAYRTAIEIASGLELVAYDAALGIGFLPDGRVIPAGLAQSHDCAPPPDDTLRGEDEVRAVLAPALASVLTSHGFAMEPEPTGSPLRTIELSRTLGQVRQRLRVRMLRYEQVEMAFVVEHEACKALYLAANAQETLEAVALRLDLDFFEPGPDSAHRWKLERHRDLEGVLAMVRDKLLPLADLTSELGGLDQMLNGDSAAGIRTPYKTAYSWLGRPRGSDGSRSLLETCRDRSARLVVAHLNGNPSTAHIAEWFDAHYADAGQARSRDAYLRLRNVLGSATPLAHWLDPQAYRASMRAVPRSLLHEECDPRGRRCHHWETTEALHQALSKDRAQFWNRFAEGGGLIELQRLWREKAETLPLSERIDPAGLGCHVTPLGGVANTGDVQVLMLEFPPIRGLDECAVLALARAGGTYRTYRMVHHHAMEDDKIRILMAYQANATITQKSLEHLLSVQEFLDFVRDTFE